jgi:hypothetical protein
METYITHFLEGALFPKAPVLAGHKVNFTLRPGYSIKPLPLHTWAVKCLDLETTAALVSPAGNTYWETFWAQTALNSLELFQAI